jgi:multicomponent Na+:H+ antiporter subunit F
MNEWHVAACVLLAALAACVWTVLRHDFVSAVIALDLAGVLAALALLALAEAERREPFADLALVLAVVSLAGSLIFARYLERGRSERERRDGTDG